MSRCGNPNCQKQPLSAEKYLVNRLTLAIRKHIQQYYAVISVDILRVMYNLQYLTEITILQGWIVCEDQSCATRTRRLPLKSVRAHPVCIGCGTSNMDVEVPFKKLKYTNYFWTSIFFNSLHSQYNDLNLYTQLCYYQHMFDAPKAINQLKPSERGRCAYCLSITCPSSFFLYQIK